jgi:hypothetical protein
VRCVVCGGNKNCAQIFFVKNVYGNIIWLNLDVVTKVKFTLEQATKAQRERRCIVLRSFNLGANINIYNELY